MPGIITLQAFTLPIGFALIPTQHTVMRNEVASMSINRPAVLTAIIENDEIACGAYDSTQAYVAKIGVLDFYGVVPSGKRCREYREFLDARNGLFGKEVKSIFISTMLNRMILHKLPVYIVAKQAEKFAPGALSPTDISAEIALQGGFSMLNVGDGLSIQPRIPVSPFHAM